MNNAKPRMSTIRLYGKMGVMFGRVHRVQLDTNTPAEAVRYLCSQFPRARAYLMGAGDQGIDFAVFRGKENIDKEQLSEPVGHDDIRIAPVIRGRKNGGWINIVLGVILVVVGFFAFGSTTTVGASLIAAGIGSAAGGVVALLTPVPKGTKNKSVTNEPSYAFNGAVNTQAQGNPVPILYGRMIVGSAVISAGLQAEDYAPLTGGVGTGSPNLIKYPNDPNRPNPEAI